MGVERLSKKEKGLMDMGFREGNIREQNGIKIK